MAMLKPMDCYNVGKRWLYISVESVSEPSGLTMPRVIVLEDGRRFEIERVARCQKMSRWGGGEFWYYEVLIRGKLNQLWWYVPSWFVCVTFSTFLALRVRCCLFGVWSLVFVGVPS